MTIDCYVNFDYFEILYYDCGCGYDCVNLRKSENMIENDHVVLLFHDHETGNDSVHVDSLLHHLLVHEIGTGNVVMQACDVAVSVKACDS